MRCFIGDDVRVQMSVSRLRDFMGLENSKLLAARCSTQAHPPHSGARDRASLRSRRRPTGIYAAVLVLSALHVGLLLPMACRDTATIDEVAHFAAGVSHWYRGTFRLYRVNPPLVRLVACAPVALLNRGLDLGPYEYVRDPNFRPEFRSGPRLAQTSGDRYLELIALARLSCIPFSLLGAWVCFLWARDLYGSAAGLCAMSLWVVCPNILAYGHLITPDIGATSVGVTAAYLFRRWLQRPTWSRAVAAGFVLGLAELTKTTWLILYALWPVTWMVYRCLHHSGGACSYRRIELFQIATILLTGVWVINIGYGFEGTFKPLGEFNFVSQSLGGKSEILDENGYVLRNRFANSWLGSVPVPLPENYVRGIDFIKMEYERKYPSFLRGEWRLGGWWYYYGYALFIKTPVGTWAVVALALAVSARRSGYSAALHEEMLLIVPLLTIIVLVSSQTGFNHHLRYVLPAFPFAFVWMSKVARSIDFGHVWVGSFVAIGMTAAAVSSLWVYPHSLSYFNELVGGPRNGHYHLLNSNIDWGQDLWYLKQWLKEHPEAKPLYLSYDSTLLDPRSLDIQYNEIKTGQALESGWYALGVNRMHSIDGDLAGFLHMDPVGRAGYSIYIYYLNSDEAEHLTQNRPIGGSRTRLAD